MILVLVLDTTPTVAGYSFKFLNKGDTQDDGGSACSAAFSPTPYKYNLAD